MRKSTFFICLGLVFGTIYARIGEKINYSMIDVIKIILIKTKDFVLRTIETLGIKWIVVAIIIFMLIFVLKNLLLRIKTDNEMEIQKSFDVFELQKSANFDDVKAKYKIMIKLFHPDKHYTDDEVKKYTDNKTIELNNAFNTLKTKHFKVI